MSATTELIRQRWRGVAAVALAGAAGLGTAVASVGGPAAAQADGQLAVQVYPLLAGSYAMPLGSSELPMTANPSGNGEWLIVSGNATGTLLDEPSNGGTPTALQANLDDGSGANPYLSIVNADG